MTHLEIASLPLPKKIQLMESLWDSICQESSGQPDMPGWHKAVLADRVTRLDAGEETVSTWEKAKKRIRAQVENRKLIMRVHITRSAEDDLVNGFAFYERQQAGIGAY